MNKEKVIEIKINDITFFIYPPLMATSTPQLAVQIQENMRGYKLNSGKVGFGSDE